MKLNIFLFASISIFCSLALCSAQTNNAEGIAGEVHEVIGIDSKSPQRQANPNLPDTSQIDFSFLKKTLENKRIVILGESSHGDGSTFKMKVDIIKYLKQTMNFNTVVFECSGLYDSYLLTHNLNGTKQTDYLIKKYGILAVLIPMWSNTKEVLPLDSLFLEGKLKLVGMDCQPNFTSNCLITSLRNYVDSIHVNLFSEKEWKLLDSVIKRSDYGYHDTADYPEIKNKLMKISTCIQSKNPVLNSQGDILIQCIKNQMAYLNELNAPSLYPSNPLSKPGVKSVNIIRDGQMADNVQWYLDRHPGEKIIIWTASFHGCKNLKGINYRPNDSETYKMDTVMGEYLNKTYGNEIYSIAFTSFEYADKYTSTLMDTTNSSLEYYLYKTGFNYGFINFDSTRIKYKTQMPRFKSIILGYNLKEGDWLSAFDGIFYIRRQEPPQQEPFHW